jgi:hypothetical protein
VEYHLAQVNVAVAKYACDDPRFSGFVDNLGRIYDLAESLPGFIWRDRHLRSGGIRQVPYRPLSKRGSASIACINWDRPKKRSRSGISSTPRDLRS